MQLAITLEENNGLESTISTIFGRCAYFMFIDPKTKEFSIVENPAQNASGVSGTQAAQWIIDQNVVAVISGNLGPKAHDVLSAGGIYAFKFAGNNIEETLDAFNKNEIESIYTPNVEAHSGTKDK